MMMMRPDGSCTCRVTQFTWQFALYKKYNSISSLCFNAKREDKNKRSTYERSMCRNGLLWINNQSPTQSCEYIFLHVDVQTDPSPHSSLIMFYRSEKLDSTSGGDTRLRALDPRQVIVSAGTCIERTHSIMGCLQNRKWRWRSPADTAGSKPLEVRPEHRPQTQIHG